MGIEPTYLAWKASVLPLNYTRKGNIYKENDCLNKQSSVGVTGFEPAASWSQIKRSSQAEPHPVSGYFVIPFASLIRDARPIILHKYHSVNNFLNFYKIPFFSFIFPCKNPSDDSFPVGNSTVFRHSGRFSPNTGSAFPPAAANALSQCPFFILWKSLSAAADQTHPPDFLMGFI